MRLENKIVGVIIFLQSLFFALTGFAQNHNQPIFFDHLTIAEGLSHNTVYCMLQDQDGYIWIGTQNGLNKYDGYTFEIYRSGEKTDLGFRGKSITALYEDREGTLWVGTAKEGINRKLKGSDRFTNFNIYDRFPELKGVEITSIFEDSKDNIWITTLGAGVLKYHPDFEASRLYNAKKGGLSEDNVFDVSEDENGKIWLATAGVGVNFLNEENEFELSKGIPGQLNMEGYHKKLFSDKENLWVATEGTGLYKMKNLTRKYLRYALGDGDFQLNSNAVRDVIRTSDGRIFAATDGGGLNVIDDRTGTHSEYIFRPDDPNGLNSNALYCLLEDRTGNIWIGSYNGGINLIKKKKTWFEFYTSGTGNPTKLEQPSVLSLYETQNGNVWIGTDGGGLNLMKNENGRTVFQKFMHDPNYPEYAIAGNVVKSIFEDSKNRLWLGCFSVGLDMFDPAKNRFEHFQLGNNIIWSIAERSDGDLLIATLGSGLNIFDTETKEFSPFNPNLNSNEPFDEKEIMVVFIDDQKRTWIGTGNNGLYLSDESTNQLYHFKNDSTDLNSISSNEIRSIFQDSRGDVWIGTEGNGLNRFSDDLVRGSSNRFQRFTKEEKLIANSIMGITEDENGLIWVTTFEGISRMNPETGEVKNFNFHTNQNSNQFNQSAILAASNGKLFFGGITGLNVISPEDIFEEASDAPIIFTDFKIHNQSIPSGKLEGRRTILEEPIETAKRIFLNYADNSFSIDFTTTDFTNSEGNIFRYKMEGFDENWEIGLRGEHSASYTNLDPGTFIFRVQRGDSEAEIEIVIKPPFWKTIWFRLLTLLAALSAIIGGFQFFANRKQALVNRQLLKAEAEILQLKNKNLETEVEAKNSKLMFSSVQMAHKKEILSGIKNELEASKGEPAKLRKVMRMLDKELEGEDYWKEFNLYFEQVDKEFVKNIQKKHPKLTQNDLRICSLIRLNLSTKEIASLLNVSVRGVEQSRYRMKKRLELTAEDDLVKYISNFNS